MGVCSNGLHIVGRKQPSLPVDFPNPPSLINLFNVLYDIIWIKRDLIISLWWSKRKKEKMKKKEEEKEEEKMGKDKKRRRRRNRR